MSAWLGDTTRNGADLELLCREQIDTASVLQTFRDIISTADDAVVFDIGTLSTAFVRPGRIGSIRLAIEATIETARIPIGLNIGYGDVVFPTPAEIKYPTLLSEPLPHIRCYRRETVLAETLQRIVAHPSEPPAPSALRDLYLLIRTFDFDAPAAARAMSATFRRRGTAMPTSLPIGLGASPTRCRPLQAQWRVLRAGDCLLKDVDLAADCLSLVAAFVGPLLKGMANSEISIGHWPAGGPWVASRATLSRFDQVLYREPTAITPPVRRMSPGQRAR